MQGRRQQGYNYPTSPAAAGGRALRTQQTPPPASQPTPTRAPASTNPAALKLWDWATKRQLRPYPVSGGNIFFNPPTMSEKDYLAPGNYASVLTCENSELCHRMGVGMSILCGTQVTVAKYFETFAQNFEANRTGIKEWAEILTSPEGKKFLESCGALNMGGGAGAKTALDVNEKDLMAHTKRFLRFLLTDNQKRSAILGKIMRFAGRLYLSSAHLLEAFALVNDPEAWCEKYLPKTQKEAWFEQPEDIGLLREFISTSLLAAVEKRRFATGRDDLLQSSADDEAPGTQRAGRPKKRAGPPKATDFTSSSDSDAASFRRTRGSKKTAKRRRRVALESSSQEPADSPDSSPIAGARRAAPPDPKQEPKKKHGAAKPAPQAAPSDSSEVATLRALVEQLLTAQAATTPTKPKAPPVYAPPQPSSQTSTEQPPVAPRTGAPRATTDPQPPVAGPPPAGTAATRAPQASKAHRVLREKKKKRRRPTTAAAPSRSVRPTVAETAVEEQALAPPARREDPLGLEEKPPSETASGEGPSKRQKQQQAPPAEKLLTPP